jgi:hypothetical protein
MQELFGSRCYYEFSCSDNPPSLMSRRVLCSVDGTLPNPKSVASLLHLGVACDNCDDQIQVSRSQLSRVHVGTDLTRSPSGQGMWRYIAAGRTVVVASLSYPLFVTTNWLVPGHSRKGIVFWFSASKSWWVGWGKSITLS